MIRTNRITLRERKFIYRFWDYVVSCLPWFQCITHLAFICIKGPGVRLCYMVSGQLFPCGSYFFIYAFSLSRPFPSQQAWSGEVNGYNFYFRRPRRGHISRQRWYPCYNKTKPRKLYLFSQAKGSKMQEDITSFVTSDLQQYQFRPVNENCEAIKNEINKTVPSRKSSKKQHQPQVEITL